MFKPSLTDADLARLQEERERADRLYNEALTALDHSLTTPAQLPPPSPPPDDTRIERLNRLWQVVPDQPVPFAGWRRRVAAFVWQVVGPMLQRQQEFNAACVDHAVRRAAQAAEERAAAAALGASVSAQFEALVRMQSRLIAYLQQVTLYVDTKDRYEVGLLWHEVERRTKGLAAGLSALGDQALKQREQAQAWERRLEARFAEMRAGLAGATDGGRTDAGRPAADGTVADAAPTALSVPETLARRQMATGSGPGVYAGFEDAYRGTTETIADRLSAYLPLFAGAGDVLDLGCGRGEFLEALARAGVTARGVDLNPEMVQRCRRLGLEVVQADGVDYLSSLPDRSIGGLFAAQVVEHLPPDRLLRLLEQARAKLRPGGRLVLETINPACWAAFFSSYIRDITHVQPVHPDTLRYLLIAHGFVNVDVRYSSPYPAEARLQPLPLTLLSEGPAAATVVEQFNRNVETLNGLLFTYLDYAAVGEAAGEGPGDR